MVRKWSLKRSQKNDKINNKLSLITGLSALSFLSNIFQSTFFSLLQKVSSDASEKVKESSHLERCIEEKDALINKLNQELRELELKLELVQLNEKEDLAQQLRKKETENIR